MGKGGNGGRVIIEESTVLPPARQGYGSVHHVSSSCRKQISS